MTRAEMRAEMNRELMDALGIDGFKTDGPTGPLETWQFLLAKVRQLRDYRENRLRTLDEYGN